jgi:hypothetical protein
MKARQDFGNPHVFVLAIVGQPNQDVEDAHIYGICCHRRPFAEKPERHNRIGCEFPLISNEDTNNYDAEHNKADDCSRRPREYDITKFQTQENHARSAHD